MHEGIYSSQLGANFLRKICKENVKKHKEVPAFYANEAKEN